MSEKMVKVLTARVGGQWYGVNVDQVIEVLHLVAFTEAPAISSDILGLITVRDQVMPLIDLRLRFGVDANDLKLDTPVVAIREQAGPVALLFDDADRVEDVPEAQITKPTDAEQFPYIRAVAKLPGRLLLLLDTHQISQESQLLTGRPAPNGHAKPNGNGRYAARVN